MPETLTIEDYKHILKSESQKRNSPESDLVQIPFFDVLQANRSRYPFLAAIYASPNSGERDKGYARRLTKEGVRSGVWDVTVPFARRGYAMFYIEFKYGKNNLTDTQRDFRKTLEDEEILWEVHRETSTALDSIEFYFDIRLAR